MKKPCILICDDEPGVRDSLKLILESDYELAFAPDGESGVNHVKANDPDLVILDIKMPRMNGLETLQKIKRIRPKAKVLILTGYESGDVATQAIRLGVANYLTKPLERHKVLSEVRATLHPPAPPPCK